MQDNSNLIKVIDVLDHHVMCNPGEIDTRVSVTIYDLVETGIDFYEFGSILGSLQNDGYLQIERVRNPSEIPQDEQETVYWVECTGGFYDLYKKLIEEREEYKVSKLQYAPETGVLTLDEKSIKFNNQFGSAKTRDLLKVVFEHPEKENDYVDIQNEYGYDPKTLGKTCDYINTRILKEFGFKDFLIAKHTVNGSVRINPKYIPKNS